MLEFVNAKHGVDQSSIINKLFLSSRHLAVCVSWLKCSYMDVCFFILKSNCYCVQVLELSLVHLIAILLTED